MAHTLIVVGPREAGNAPFGDFLRKAREVRFLSRGDVADRVGCSSEFVRLIEAGQRSPAFGMALLILDMFEIAYKIQDDLLYFENGTVIEFTSRIRSARNAQVAAQIPTVRDREQLLGKIICLLPKVSMVQLDAIYKQLTDKE